ncbi:MAG: Eco57I restriction-modification methylase domain-containing protein [Candidatus Ancillula trichonymphae]|nr:Eco57I restriction-modification methylase domain-containing protein [Candidatus Ancillula trichonymphae]
MQWGGDPPYQEDTKDTSDRPIYNDFMDISHYEAEKSELIHPTRFLFFAGKTAGDWSEKLLKSEHFRVDKTFHLSGNVFPNTDIKGGIAITHYDKKTEFKSIDTFAQFRT